MSKRWSKLQRRLYNLREPSIDFQIHCALYEMNSNNGRHSVKLPRYFITIDKEIIFDYPRACDRTWKYGFDTYPAVTDIGAISDLIEEYIQCPDAELLKDFENDKWGITDILRVCDRRIGKRRLREMKEFITDEKLVAVINRRLDGI